MTTNDFPSLSATYYCLSINSEDQEGTLTLPDPDSVVYKDGETLEDSSYIMHTDETLGGDFDHGSESLLDENFRSARDYFNSDYDISEEHAWMLARNFDEGGQGNMILALCFGEPSYGSLSEAFEQLGDGEVPAVLCAFQEAGLEMSFRQALMLAGHEETNNPWAAGRYLSYLEAGLEITFSPAITFAAQGYSAEQVAEAIKIYGSAEAAADALFYNGERPVRSYFCTITESSYFCKITESYKVKYEAAVLVEVAMYAYADEYADYSDQHHDAGWEMEFEDFESAKSWISTKIGEEADLILEGEGYWRGFTDIDTPMSQPI